MQQKKKKKEKKKKRKTVYPSIPSELSNIINPHSPPPNFEPEPAYIPQTDLSTSTASASTRPRNSALPPVSSSMAAKAMLKPPEPESMAMMLTELPS